MPDIWKAEGHRAKILKFDGETALVPLNADEARRLHTLLRGHIKKLEATGDFPEKQEYENLLKNLITAEFLIQS